MSEISSSHPHMPRDQCPAVRTVGAASYRLTMKLTDRRKKTCLKELELHGIATRAAAIADIRGAEPLRRNRPSVQLVKIVEARGQLRPR